MPTATRRPERLMLLQNLTNAAANFLDSLAEPQQLLALASVVIAVALTVAGSVVRTIVPLRWLAVGSNIGFMLYGALHPSLPMLALHLTLLPINLVRVVQMTRLTRRVAGAVSSHDDWGIWLRPYMRTARLKAGAVLFRKGDIADQLYLLAEGRIELVEIGMLMEPGRVFGEIAFFAPDRRRTVTARCVAPCTVLSINEEKFKELYYQNPDFGFEVVRLVAGRLSGDVQRLRAQLAQQPPAQPPPAPER
jgi:hypothetical protein